MKTIMLSGKAFGGKTVVALGKFDGIHTGHARLLECAVSFAAQKEALGIVYIMEPRDGARLNATCEKSDIIRSFGIDALCIEPLTDEFMSMTPETFVADILKDKLNACHVVVGYNSRFGKNRSGDTGILKKLCADHGISLSVIDCVYAQSEGKSIAVSSSEIRHLASLGKVAQIIPLLGRSFSVSGEVMQGKKLGRTIDFPTANIYRRREEFPLKHGVYMTEVLVDGEVFGAVTNVGINPTVEHTDDIVKIESHIPDFDKDLYGKEITVRFLEYIREEKKFSSIDELKAQISRDKEYLTKQQAGDIN